MRGARKHRVGALLVVVGLGLVGLQCSSKSSDGGGTTVPPASQVVGTTGGTVRSGDGSVVVSVPKGALDHDVTISIAAATSPLAGAVGTVYEIGPTGTTFAVPVTIAIHADASAGAPSSLRVATVEGGAWRALSSPSFDAASATVSGATSHLSPYALIAGSADDAGTDRPTCTGAAADGPPGGPYPRCATSSPCSHYPGSSVASCTDTPTGYEATCCPGDAGGVDAGGDGGDASASCTPEAAGGPAGGPYPRCATSSPCSHTPGTYAASCTDTATGYEATCCPGGAGDSGDAG